MANFKTIEEFANVKRENPRGFKSLSFSVIELEGKASSDRIKTGLAALTGNIDSGYDRIHSGAFLKTLSDDKTRFRHLWNHRSENPPIASIKEIEEIGTEKLPDAVKLKYPEITGGLLVTREYYDNELSNWVLTAINNGDINEMSFAYEVVKASFSEEEIEGTGRTKYIREIHELKLYETSDVNWGMNAATVASLKGLEFPKSIGMFFEESSKVLQSIKEGRELTPSDIVLLQQLQKDFSLFSFETEKPNQEESQKAEAVETINYTSLFEDYDAKIKSLKLNRR